MPFYLNEELASTQQVSIMGEQGSTWGLSENPVLSSKLVERIISASFRQSVY